MSDDVNKDHDFYRERISAFHDRELSEADHQALRDHLRQCSDCRQMLANLRRLDEIVDERGNLDGDEYFEESARKIERKLGFATAPEVVDIRPARFTGHRWKIAAVAASVAVLTFIGLQHDEIMEGIFSDGALSEQSWETPRGSERTQAGRYQPNVVPPEQDYSPIDLEMDVPVSSEPVEPLEASDESRDQSAPLKIMSQDIEVDKREKKTTSRAEDEVGSLAEAVPSTPSFGSGAPQRLDDGGTKGSGAPNRVEKSGVARHVMSKEQIETKPVSTVDELLSDVSGVVTSSQGDVFIRDGRAGEVNFIQATDSLEFWRVRRDSLSGVFKRVSEPQSGVANKTSQLVQSEDVEEQSANHETERNLVESYYRIAILTTDDTERMACLDSLREHRNSGSATNRELAKKYLEELTN